MTTESASRECKYGNTVAVSRWLRRPESVRSEGMLARAEYGQECEFLPHAPPDIRIRAMAHPRTIQRSQSSRLSLSYTIVLSEAPILRRPTEIAGPEWARTVGVFARLLLAFHPRCDLQLRRRGMFVAPV